MVFDAKGEKEEDDAKCKGGAVAEILQRILVSEEYLFKRELDKPEGTVPKGVEQEEDRQDDLSEEGLQEGLAPGGSTGCTSRPASAFGRRSGKASRPPGTRSRAGCLGGTS